MAFDYDIVILGGSRVALEAAIAANALKARVALVEPSTVEPVKDFAGDWPSNILLPLLQQMQQTQYMGLSWCGDRIAEPKPPTIDFDRLRRWLSGATADRVQHHSGAVLSSLGIDAIRGNGEFCRQPTLHVAVNGRRLRGRNYLLAVGSRHRATEIEGLDRTGYLTPQTLLQWIGKEQRLPQGLTIIGDEPTSIEIAQILVRLGTQVSVIVAGPHILPHEDPEAARWIQAQLEAEGVRVLTHTSVTQTKAIDGKKWVQAGNLAIAADEILLATPRQPRLASLNLKAAHVRVDGGLVRANAKLQTTNPQIYACGETLGGYAFESIGNREARVAIQNALFYPNRAIDYRSIPWATFSEPSLARVGLTEPQARERYGEDCMILRPSLGSISKYQYLGETGGFCKAIVRSNGEILGVHLICSEAGELIHPFALAIENHVKIGDAASLATVDGTRSQIYAQLDRVWQQHPTHLDRFIRNLLEAWLRFRRG